MTERSTRMRSPRHLAIGAARNRAALQVAVVALGTPCLGLAALTAQVPQAPVVATCTVPDSISDALERIARRVGGNVGVSAIHLESGARITLNGDRPFPMASVSKIPMALEFLRLVDAGEIDLDATLVVPPEDFRPGHSPLASWSGGRPVERTLDSLLALMIGVSDNTATDVILRLAGGPEAATRRVRDLGVGGVTVDRSEARTFADLSGIPEWVPESELYRYAYFRLRDSLPQAQRDAARERFGRDPRDNATPDGMAELLTRIHFGIGMSEASRARLLDIMAGSPSGPRRLKGLLPDSTRVAHKTGTMAGAINDVGIITLPDGGGHLVVAAFVNTLHQSTRRRERTIAEASRLLYDHFADFTARTRLAGAGPGAPLGSC